MSSKQSDKFLGGPKKLTSKGGKGGLWGRSPRLSPEEIPEWAREFQEQGWSAAPNPQAIQSKQQRRARMMLWLILASLPVSLLSCVIAITRSSSPPPVISETDDANRVPQAQIQAQIVAQDWLQSSGLRPETMIWQGFEESNLPCTPRTAATTAATTAEEATAAVNTDTITTTTPDPDTTIKCEEHTFRAHLAQNNQWVKITVTLHPRDGTVAGVHILAEPQPAIERPVWNRQPRYEEVAVLPSTFITTATDWITAWTTNDQKTLRDLARYVHIGSNESFPEFAWFGLPGWLVVPDSATNSEDNLDVSSATPITVLSKIGPKEKNVPFSQYLVTVQFSIALECIQQSVVIPNTPEGSPSDSSEENGYQVPRCAECPGSAISPTGSTNTNFETQSNNRNEPIIVTDLITGEPTGRTTCGNVLNITTDLHLEQEPSSEQYEPEMFVVDYGAVGTFDPEQVFLQPSEDDDIIQQDESE